MMIQRVSADSQEILLSVVKNVNGGTLSAGAACVYELGTNMDGVRVTTPATATLGAFAGVTVEAIADQTKGRIRLYGFQSQIYVTNDTSNAIAAGDILIPVNGQTWLARSGAGNGLSGFVIAGEAYATATAGGVTAAYKKGFVRAL